MKLLYTTLFCFCALFVEAQDTTYQTYQVSHDTSVTTTIPEQYICRDSSIEVLDTVYNSYFNYKLYAQIDGSVFITIQLCDTIAAHDTSFVTTTTHDTTVAIITLRQITVRYLNENKAFGTTFTFPHNASRIVITNGTLKSGDVITTDNAISAGSASIAAAGAYPITTTAITIFNGVTNVTAGYSITYQTGTLTVAPAIPITITADDQGKSFGQIFTFTHTGTQVDVTGGALNSGDAITVDDAASSGSAPGAVAGSYPITLSSVSIFNGATNVTNQYAITYVAGTLTVAAAPLIITVRARNQVKLYGSTFTFTHTGGQVQVTSGGLASGDQITVDNAASTGAVNTAVPGSYTITLSSITIMNGATNVTGNYTITYASGTLTVNAIPITVKANNQTKVQGASFTFLHNGSQVSLTSGSLLSGDAITVDNAASTGSGTGALTGSYAITLSSVSIFNGATNNTSHYAITYQGGTLTVTQPAGPGLNYGVFVLTSPTYPTFQSRLDQAHYINVPVFRYNYTYGMGQYRVGDIIDDGLRVALTWNPRDNNGTYFPIGTAEINFYAAKLDSFLKLTDKPELVSINNEEGHREYWKGTVADYLNWFEACVTVSHNNGIPISNGGTTIGIVYAMLQWYIDEGKPADSIQFIKDAFGITGSATGAYATQQREWYQQLLAGFALSDMDYVNMHWYEPARDNFTDTVTSGLVPLIINYIQSITGKSVITTETGTKNANNSLLYEMLDQYKAASVAYLIYFAGSSDQGAHAYDNSEGYKAWLLQ